MKITIVGGGIIGLSAAFYLLQDGHEVTIIDKGAESNNCSFGNAGYISPSHFIPLASPGIVAQGLKWMLSSTSPFYIKPRLDISLIKWGLTFWSKANAKTVAKSAPHLNNILQYSRDLTIEMDQVLGGKMELHTDGCFMLYRKESTGEHERHLCHEAKQYNIEARMLDKDELRVMEPNHEINALGAAYYPIDCHLHPIKTMQELQNYCIDRGVNIMYQTEVVGFKQKEGKVKQVKTNKGDIDCDHLVVASGSWLPITAKQLGLSLLLQPGKGYSTTYRNVANNINYPAILVDDRVAMTPLGNDLRIGGTMELSGYNHHINMNRVKPIVAAVNNHYTDFQLPVPDIKDVWAGLRPCTPDGLPYVGRSPKHQNVIIAGGHAMVGISLAAGTGKIVSDIIENRKTAIDIQAFKVARF